MASLVLGVVGAAIGSTFGYASLGWSIGSFIGRSLGGGSDQKSYGPRLENLTVQSSSEGAPLPEIWGSWRLSGNVIWSTGLIETVTEVESGGGGKGDGGGGSTSILYTYRSSFAVALCEGPVGEVRKIWADSKLIYNKAVKKQLPAGVTFYNGSSSQEPDPTIQAAVGVLNCPAYRNTAYMVFKDFQLASYGNRIPNISVELATGGSYQAAPTITSVTFSSNFDVVGSGGNLIVALQGGTTSGAYGGDGILWNPTTLPATFDGDAIVFGNTTFVAPSSYLGVYKSFTSSDGSSWAANTMPNAAGAGGAIAFGNNLFVAAAYSSSDAAYSADGISWTSASMSSISTWKRMAFGNGIFCCICDGSNKVAISSNGVSWTEGTMPQSGYSSIAFGNNLFVAVRDTAYTKVAVSSDGLNWSEFDLPESASIRYIAWSEVMFFAFPYASSTYYTSEDGITWTKKPLLDTHYPRQTPCNRGEKLLSISPTNSRLFAFDALAWGPPPWSSAVYPAIRTSDSRGGLFWTGSFYLQLNLDGTKAWRSLDGFTWTEHAISGGSKNPGNLTKGGDLIVSCCYNADYILTTVDGATWNTLSTPFDLGGEIKCAYGGVFVGLQGGGFFTSGLYSEDGSAWSEIVLPEAFNCSTIEYGLGKFVALGITSSFERKCALSTNGIDWVFILHPEQNKTIAALKCNGLLFTALTYSPAVTKGYWSTNGINWYVSTVPNSSQTWNQIAWDGNYFLAASASSGSQLLYSEDGKIWKEVTVTGMTRQGPAPHESGFLNLTNTDAEIITPEALITTSVTLATIIKDLSEAAGLSIGELVTSQLIDVVLGYCRTQPMTARAAIEPLQAIYLFDVVESSGNVHFLKRGSSSVATINEAELVVNEDNDSSIELVRAQELELPNEITLQFADNGRDHQPGVVYARRLATASRQLQQLEIPILIDSQTAIRSAEILLREAWRGRTTLKFDLPPQYLYIDPADVITINQESTSFTVRLKKSELDLFGSLKCEAVSEDIAGYTSSLEGTTDTWIEPDLNVLVSTRYTFLDLPIINESEVYDYMIWLASGGDGPGYWPGSLAYISRDEESNFTLASTNQVPSPIGFTYGTLGSGRTDIFDETNFLRIEFLSRGYTAPVSASELSVLSGANAAAVGAPGRWEIIQFKYVYQVSEHVFVLSGLLRGRKGTEWAVDLHQDGDTIILLNASSAHLIQLSSTDYNVARPWKVITVSESLDDTPSESLTYEAQNLKPYAPVLLGGGRDASGNLTITWIRRNRLTNEWIDGSDVPMSESSEAYEIEIWTSGYASLKRTITASVQTCSYTAAEQTTDFGGTQATVYVRVYQMSSLVGRGAPLQGSI